jgi:trimeric autotransporter adhesin
VLAAAGATFSNPSRKRPYTASSAVTATAAAAVAAEAYTPVPAATPGALVVLDAVTAQPSERSTSNCVLQQQALNKVAVTAAASKATSGKQTAVASVTPAPRRPLQHRVTFADDSPIFKTSKSNYDVVHDYSMLKALLEAKLQQCEQGSSAFSTVLSDIAKVDRELARLQQADSYKCTDATAVGVVDESVACTPTPEPWSYTVTSSSNNSSRNVYSSARPSVFHAVRSEAAGAVDVALSRHVYSRSTPSTDMKVRFSLDDDVCSNTTDVASTNTHSSSALKAVVEQSNDTSSSSSSSNSSSSSSSGNSAPATPPRSARPVQNTAPRNHHILQFSSQLTPATASSTQTFTNIGSRSSSKSNINGSSSFGRLCSKITTGSRRSAIQQQQQQQQQWEADAIAVASTECSAIDDDKVVMPPPCGFGDWAVIASAINVNTTSTSSAIGGTFDTVSSSAGVNNLASLFSAAASTAPALTVVPQQQQQQQRVAAAATDAITACSGGSGSCDAAADDEKAVCTSALWKGSVEMSDSPAALACALFTRSKSEMRCSSTAATERGVRSSSGSSGHCDDNVKTAKDMPKEQQWWVRSDELLNSSSSSSVGVDDSTEHDSEHTTVSNSSKGSGSGSGTHSGSSSDCEDRGQSVAHLVSIVDNKLGGETQVQQLVTPEQSPTKYANTANFWAKSAVKPAAASAVKAAATSTAAHRVGAGEIAVVDSAVDSSTATSAAIQQVAQQQEHARSAVVASQGSSDDTAITTTGTSSSSAAAVRAVATRPVMRQLSGLFNAEHSTALAVVDSTFDFSEANKENIPPHYAVMSVNKKQQQCKKSVHLTAALQFQRNHENTATTAATTANGGRVLGVTPQPQPQQQQQLSARQALAGCSKATNSK